MRLLHTPDLSNGCSTPAERPVAVAEASVDRRYRYGTEHFDSTRLDQELPELDTDILTINQAAQFLQLSKDTVYRLVAKGKLPGRKVGRVWRFHRRAIEAFVMEAAPSNALTTRKDDDNSFARET